MDKEGSSSSPSYDIESGSSVLDYISKVLMEEDDMEEKPCMFHDALALQSTEKSLYEVLGETYPPVLTSPCVYGSADQSLDCRGSTDPPWNDVFMENDSIPSYLETQPTTSDSTLPSALRYRNAFSNDGDEVLGSSVSELAIPNYFLQSEGDLQFNKGMQEARKFLPKLNHLTTSPENIALSSEQKEMSSKTEGRAELEERKFSPSHDEREDESAISIDENELLELSDKVLLCSFIAGHSPTCVCGGQSSHKKDSEMSEQKEQTNGSRGGKSRSHTKKKRDKKEVIDLRTLLISCAQALSCNDLKTVNEYLKQIRQHSSCFGDANQRLAHVFANALEARIEGTGTQIYTAMSSKIKPASKILEAHELHLSTSPFWRSAVFFANHSILEFVKETKATSLHIIDFGISRGFQWPPLIMRLLRIHGGHPKLRITGIELPLHGFSRNDSVWDTRCRLARYCKRFNVPFEYNAIAQKCETIQVEDLKLRPNEVVVVNCLFQLQKLLDNTIAGNNPRDTVLNLIRKINPDMFIHSVVHGSFGTPFFFPRFRDALFHFSALFEIFDSSVPREDESRLMVEQDVFGWTIMNVVACEGAERIERPESYKQWQVRSTRAGFRQRALDHKLLNKLRGWLKDDFTVENDGEWMLQGWRGKILCASSIWLPARSRKLASGLG